MGTYSITLSGEHLNEYIEGRISGMIYVLTGMPNSRYAWRKHEDDERSYLNFKATEEQYNAICEAIDKTYFGFIEYDIVYLG